MLWRQAGKQVNRLLEQPWRPNPSARVLDRLIGPLQLVQKAGSHAVSWFPSSPRDCRLGKLLSAAGMVPLSWLL